MADVLMCDMCGKIMPHTNPYPNKVEIYLPNETRTYKKFDFCDDCMEKISNFVKDVRKGKDI